MAADDDDLKAGLDGSACDIEPAGSGEPVDDREARVRLARLRGAAGRVDTDPRWVEMVRRVRRMLPGDAKFGDPLSTAGRAPVEVIARGVTTLRSEPESLVKEIGLSGLQVWQSISEATGRGRGDHELALLFTDLVGFSAWALKVGDAAALELLRAVGVSTEAAILERQGRIVKRLGDGLMATFMHPGPAVDAALEAQEAIRDIEIDGYTPHMRIGLHWGRPRRLGGDYLGIDVNVAARVAEAAKADQVLVSSDVLARIDRDAVRTGRPRRLRADGAPAALQVVEVARAY